jgi:hypothetical protein
MKTNRYRLVFVAQFVFTAACLAASASILKVAAPSGNEAHRASRQGPGAAQPGKPQAENADPAAIQQFNADQVAALMKQIAGKEEQPAGDVFKNVKVFKAVPAGRFLKIMQLGYAPALGVKCTHCHSPEDWASDSKLEKQIARDMNAMVQTINGTLLKNINNLKGPNPIVNCTTCHRGQVKPALNLPATGAH